MPVTTGRTKLPLVLPAWTIAGKRKGTALSFPIEGAFCHEPLFLLRCKRGSACAECVGSVRGTWRGRPGVTALAGVVPAPPALVCAATHRPRRVCEHRSSGKTHTRVLFKTKTGSSYLAASPPSPFGVSFRVVGRRPAAVPFPLCRPLWGTSEGFPVMLCFRADRSGP